MDDHPQAKKLWSPEEFTRSEGTAWHSLAWHHSRFFCRSNRKRLAPHGQWLRWPLQQPRPNNFCQNANTLSVLFQNRCTMRQKHGFHSSVYQMLETLQNLQMLISIRRKEWWLVVTFCFYLSKNYALTSRLHDLYRPLIVRKVPNCQMLESIFDLVLEVIQFTVICSHYKPFKAGSWSFDVKTCPLANIWVYGEHC